MAVSAKHYINEVEIYPVNGDDIGFRMDFTGKEGVTVNEINVDSVVLAMDAKKLVLEHIATYGIFQGLPYTIKIEDVVLEYYIDLVSNPQLSGDGDSDVEVKLKKRKSYDWFKTNADNLTFEAINRTHTIPTKKTKYVIVRDNQGMIMLTSFLAAYSLATAIAEQVKAIKEGIGDLTSASTPIPSTGAAIPSVIPGSGGSLTGYAGFQVFGAVTIAPVVSTSTVKIGELLWAVLKLALQVAYLLLTILAFIQMMKNIVQVVYPRIRELKSSSVHKLMSIGCEKLGYTFQSSIITSSTALTILPVPVVDTNSKSVFLESLLPSTQPNYNKGYPTDLDTTPTLGSLFDAFLKKYNAKLFVDGNIVKLERRDFLENTSSEAVKVTLNLQDKRENRYTYNTGEAWKRYYLHSQVDFSDSHTTDLVSGTKCEYSTEPINSIADDLVNIKGLVDISIPFAWGGRKNQLMPSEKFWGGVCTIVDKVAGIFGTDSDLGTDVKARIGVVQISQPHFSITKLLYQIGSKQPSNYRDFLNTNTLYQEYHEINEVDKNFKRISTAKVPFSSKEFQALQGNNYIYNLEGDKLEILSFEWINKTKLAQIEYAKKVADSTNTKTVKIYG